MNKQFTMAVIVAVLMSFVCPMTSWAYSVTIDGVRYDLYDSKGEASVGVNSGIGGDLVIPALVSYNGKDYAVTKIVDYACYNCSDLISVVIPEGVTSIGGYAFAYCDGLTSVVIPKGVACLGEYAFAYCDGLTSVVISEGVTSIGQAAFSDCDGLTSMVIPEGVTNIGEYAFYGCSGLTSVVIPASVTSIGEGAFSGCSGLTSVVVPASVTNIGNYAFSNCPNLTDIYLCSVTPPTNDNGWCICTNGTPATIHVPVGSKAAYMAVSRYSWWMIDEQSHRFYFGKNVIGAFGFLSHIPVSLLNADAITAFRFDLSLPSGVTLRKVQEGDGERYDISLNDARADTSHVVSVSMLSDRKVRVVVYSTGNVPFKGNDGMVLSVGVDVSAAVVPGEYALRMENIESITPEGQEYQLPSIEGRLEVKNMIIPGDANGDGRVTISDVILAVNYILVDATSDNSFSVFFSAADLNGDGRISLGDVLGIINIILSGEGGGNAKARSMSESAEQTDALFSVSLDRGDNRLLFSLDNATDYTAFQLDVTLPEGVSVNGAKVGSRASGHTIDWRMLSDGKVRVVVYSPTNALLKSVDGPLFSLQLSASGKLSESFPVSVSDILLATPRGAEYKSRSLSELLSIDDAVEEVRSGEPFTISVAEGVLQVHATEAARLPLYTVGGTLLRVLEVEIGLNTYEGLSQGVYLLNGHKVLVP